MVDICHSAKIIIDIKYRFGRDNYSETQKLVLMDGKNKKNDNNNNYNEEGESSPPRIPNWIRMRLIGLDVPHSSFSHLPFEVRLELMEAIDPTNPFIVSLLVFGNYTLLGPLFLSVADHCTFRTKHRKAPHQESHE